MSEEETPATERPNRIQRLEQEGDIAADYLEELLDIADLDGDLDMDVEGDRAAVSILGGNLDQLIGARDASEGGLTATAGATLAGDLRSRASVAVDGDDATAWQTPVNEVSCGCASHQPASASVHSRARSSA